MMSERRPPRIGSVTDAELSVLQVLWARGPSTIRAITAEIYPDESTSEYATVQKLLSRLEKKRAVRRDRSGFAHVFEAAIGRDDFVGQQVESVAKKLGAGSLTSLLVQLVGSRRLSAADRAALRRMLDDAEKSK